MSKQINKKLTKLIRVDAGWHKILKLRVTEEGRSIKDLVEEIFSSYIYDPVQMGDKENA